jgi:hypothetical protein
MAENTQNSKRSWPSAKTKGSSTSETTITLAAHEITSSRAASPKPLATGTTDKKNNAGEDSLQPSPTSTVSGDAEAPYDFPKPKGTIDLLSVADNTCNIFEMALAALALQATRLSDLNPVLEAEEQLDKLYKALDERKDAQSDRVSKLKTDAAEAGKQIKKLLQSAVAQLVKSKVQKEMTNIVMKQLEIHFPQKLRDDIKHNRRVTSQVKLDMHNSEARRNNALALQRKDSPKQKLEKLHRSNKYPTPSLSFPENLAGLYSLSEDDVKKLLKDYRLDFDSGGDRVLLINRFLIHIGASGHHFLPTKSPLIATKNRN